MNEHDMTEQAYKNGYEAGKRDATSKWISVKDGLPQAREVQWDDLRYMESEFVLGFGGDGITVVKCTREIGTDRWLWIDIDGDAWPVSHWMPLPELPEGE